MESFYDILLMIGSTLFMIFFFGACIFIHELGHFLAARLCGLKVLAFSIGFRKIWGKTINGVEYRIGWIPFGGYVDLPQIDATDDEVKDKDGNVLPKAEPWKRIVTAFAGPLFNILFGFALGCVIWIAGLPQESPKMSEFTVKSVEVESPEYAAGLREGDVIIKRNGQTFDQSWGEFARDIMLNVGETTLTVKRNGETLDITYLPAINHKIAPTEEIPYPFFRPEIPVTIYPGKDSPAANAGLRKGDRILTVNGKDITDTSDFHYQILFSQGKDLVLTVQTADTGEVRTVTVKPVIPEGVDKEKDGSWMTGITFASPESMTVEQTIAGLPAEHLLQKGDVIKQVNGTPCATVSTFREIINKTPGAPMKLTIDRNGTEIEKEMAAVFILPYHIGVSMRVMTYPSPWKQFMNVLELTWRSLKSVTAGVKRQLGFDAGYTTLGVKHLSGPVGIGKHLYISVYKGSLVLGLNLVVLITFNLGLLNLLPIPVLDGGHIVLALLEMIFRRKVPAKVLQPIAFAFVGFLILFMLFVTFYDVKKLIPTAPAADPAKTEKAAENANP